MFDPDFLLDTPSARRLYHETASDLPLIDYHTHLDPREILADRRFQNATELWLEADHYKWRLMRANGVPEELVTGDAAPREKFRALAGTLRRAYGHPVHHWCHMELQRVFGIAEWLDERNADRIYDRIEEALASHPSHSARGFLRRFRTEAVCTTDDPADPLDTHVACAREVVDIAIYPTFRPDNALRLDAPDLFNAWVVRLAETSGVEIGDQLDTLAAALDSRHEAFHEAGCRLSDHGLAMAPAVRSDDAAAARAFASARQGASPGAGEQAAFADWLLRLTAAMNHRRGWTMQLHLGPVRNPNSRIFAIKGADAGTDTMSDAVQSGALLAFLEKLSAADILPRIIAYNLNPNDNTALCAALQSFQDGSEPGKLQFGAAWWFNDHLSGMRAHYETLAAQGLSGRFVGMLTDSRSLVSGVRHELFRRLICSIVGRDVEAGLMPGGGEAAFHVANICYHNARQYLGLPCHQGDRG